MNKNEMEILKKGKMICRNTQFCKGKDVGVHGRMFGANLMEELDSVCAVFAAEVIQTPWVVTKTMNIEFVSPILPNQIYKTYIGIENIGKTSIKLYTEIKKHSVHTGKEKVAVKCEAIFVRISEEGEAIKISEHIKEKMKI